MERSEWLTEARIKGYFSKLAASQRFNTNNPSLDQIEDSCSMLDMCQKTQEAIDVAKNQEDAEDTHPIVIHKIDICSIAKDLCKFGDRAQGMAELSAIKAAKLRKVIKEIATDMPRRLNQTKAADIITQHVKEHCDCLPLSSYDKWHTELKSTFRKGAGAKFME